MEYQQFINFLKKHKCYDEFLKLYSKHLCRDDDVFGLTIEERFKKYPNAPICSCLDYRSIYNEDKTIWRFWLRLEIFWQELYM